MTLRYGLPVKVIGGVESDPVHYARFEEFYGCPGSDVLSFHDIRRLVLGLETGGIPIFMCDILELTATCFGRCPLRKIHKGVTDLDTNRLANDDLFDDWGIRLVAALKPLYVAYEMTPPHSGPHKSHAHVTHKLPELDYLASDFERFPCNLTGARTRTSRFRWISVGFGKDPMTAVALQLTVSLACSPSHCLSTIASSRRSYAQNGALAFGVLLRRLPSRLATRYTPVPNLSASSLIATAILIALLTRDAKSTAWVLRLLLLLRQIISIFPTIVARILYMSAFVSSSSWRSSKSLASATISTQPRFSSLDLRKMR